jgi:hypothetical protein
MSARVFLAAILPMLGAVSDAQGQAGVDAEASPRATFVTLEKVEVPIFGNSRIEGRIDARLVLQLPDPAASAVTLRHMPEIRTRIVESMLDYGSLYVSGFAPIDAQRLSAALNASVKAQSLPIERVLIVELTASPV